MTIAFSPPIDSICRTVKIVIPIIQRPQKIGKTHPVDGFLVQVSHHIPKNVPLWRLYEYRSLSHESEL